jgi:hypothetical protein
MIPAIVLAVRNAQPMTMQARPDYRRVAKLAKQARKADKGDGLAMLAAYRAENPASMPYFGQLAR